MAVSNKIADNNGTYQYKDIDVSFLKHPITNDIRTKTDVEAIKQSVSNLLQTSFYERAFHPEIGSLLKATLFEPLDDITKALVFEEIKTIIKNWEPRVILQDVEINEDPDGNELRITVSFQITGRIELGTITQTVSLIRVR